MDDVCEQLANERRRLLFDVVDENGEIELGDAAEIVAARENGVDVEDVTSKQRKAAYVCLYQSHLDTLADLGILDVDRRTWTMAPGDEFEAVRAIQRELAARTAASFGKYSYGDKLTYVGPDELPGEWAAPKERDLPYTFCHVSVGGSLKMETRTGYPRRLAPEHPANNPEHWRRIDGPDGDRDDPVALADGGSAECGRRTCERDAAVTWMTMRGGIRTRCDVHALADGVDGIGDSRAEAIIDAISLETLVERVEGADGAHAPTALSTIDGLGPTSASRLAENIDRSPVASSVRDHEEGA